MLLWDQNLLHIFQMNWKCLTDVVFLNKDTCESYEIFPILFLHIAAILLQIISKNLSKRANYNLQLS